MYSADAVDTRINHKRNDLEGQLRIAIVNQPYEKAAPSPAEVQKLLPLGARSVSRLVLPRLSEIVRLCFECSRDFLTRAENPFASPTELLHRRGSADDDMAKSKIDAMFPGDLDIDSMVRVSYLLLRRQFAMAKYSKLVNDDYYEKHRGPILMSGPVSEEEQA